MWRRKNRGTKGFSFVRVFQHFIDINEGRRKINFKLRITNIYIVSGGRRSPRVAAWIAPLIQFPVVVQASTLLLNVRERRMDMSNNIVVGRQ